MTVILHLDDNPLFLSKTEEALIENNFDHQIIYHQALNEADFRKKKETFSPDCFLLDIIINDDEQAGMKILESIRKDQFRGPIIMLSNVAEVDTISECAKHGASDFITKGLEPIELAYRIVHCIKSLQDVHAHKEFNHSFVTGETLRKIQYKILRILKSNIRSVLVTGDSGTGKEIVSKLLVNSLSPGIPFVPVNCAAISGNLVESELFGHVKGAFTGASTSKQGFFTKADNGWIFLDEVARLSPGAQASLLRTLESGEVQKVGGESVSNVNVRVMAATNENLEEMVEEGTFRGDLLQRLRAYEIYLSPLSERSLSEKKEILESLLYRLNTTSISEDDEYHFSPETYKLFINGSWKRGNVREMWQTLQAASVDADNGLITLNCLPKSFLNMLGKKEVSDQNPYSRKKHEFPVSLPDLESQLFIDCLIDLNNSQSTRYKGKVATNLGISRWNLDVRLEKLRQKEIPNFLKPLLPSPNSNNPN